MNKTNYSRMKSPGYTQPAKLEIEEVTETVEEQVVEPEVNTARGKVIDCKKLRVRRLPNPKADVICLLDEGDSVMINLDKSTTTFYEITTSAGVEGYCMKQYVAVL